VKHLLEVVALTHDVPEKQLRRGQVETVVELLAPGVVEVEFSDLDGNPYAVCAIPENSLMYCIIFLMRLRPRNSGNVGRFDSSKVAGFEAHHGSSDFFDKPAVEGGMINVDAPFLISSRQRLK